MDSKEALNEKISEQVEAQGGGDAAEKENLASKNTEPAAKRELLKREEDRLNQMR